MYSGKTVKNLKSFILSRVISIGLYATVPSSTANTKTSENAIRMRFYLFRKMWLQPIHRNRLNTKNCNS